MQKDGQEVHIRHPIFKLQVRGHKQTIRNNHESLTELQYNKPTRPNQGEVIRRKHKHKVSIILLYLCENGAHLCRRNGTMSHSQGKITIYQSAHKRRYKHIYNQMTNVMEPTKHQILSIPAATMCVSVFVCVCVSELFLDPWADFLCLMTLCQKSRSPGH